MPSIPNVEVVPKRSAARGAAVVTALLCFSLAGCGGAASSNTPSGESSDGGSSDVCAALARFDNVFQAAVNAVNGYQGLNAVQGSLSSVKEQYILVDKELKKTDPKAAEDLANAMADLQNAISKVPPGTDPAKVGGLLAPKVDQVKTVVTEAETKEGCPTG
jgi:hypothetical protein